MPQKIRHVRSGIMPFSWILLYTFRIWNKNYLEFSVKLIHNAASKATRSRTKAICPSPNYTGGDKQNEGYFPALLTFGQRFIRIKIGHFVYLNGRSSRIIIKTTVGLPPLGRGLLIDLQLLRFEAAYIHRGFNKVIRASLWWTSYAALADPWSQLRSFDLWSVLFAICPIHYHLMI